MDSLESTENQMQDSPPNITAVMVIFIAITIAYIIAKYVMFPSSGGFLGLGYITVVLIFQYFFNMWTMLGVHQNSNSYVGLASLSIWAVFIILYFIINLGFTSWKIPFSNTIGYFVANMLFNSNKMFKSELAHPGTMPMVSSNSDEIPKDSGISGNNNSIRDAIRFMNSDPGIVLTKSTYETFPTFWKNIGDANLLKPGWNTQTDGNYTNPTFTNLLKWYYLKDLVSEGLWLILIGCLSILVSYNYIHDNNMAPSDDAIDTRGNA